MGIVNVTPDSFSDGGETLNADSAVLRALRLIEEGADIIDIGGESSRPGSDPVELKDELARVIPVIERLAPQIQIPISIDTYKSEVAHRALEAGASIINDISAGNFDPNMPSIAADCGAGVILMHIKGTPRNMQVNPDYKDVIDEVGAYLKLAEINYLEAGVLQKNIIVDPGIGFGKNLNHNLAIINNLGKFKGIGTGILLGTSRKSFIGLLTGRPVHERLAGTIGSVAVGVCRGVDIVRVHDVAEVVDSLKVIDAILRT